MENTWAKLPSHLQFMVLKRLSRLDLCQLQCSCHYFNSLLSNLEFVIEYEKNRPAHARFYLQAPRDLWDSAVVGQEWKLVASGDGLLCYDTYLRPSRMQRIFWVYNPLFPSDGNSRILMAPVTDHRRKKVREIAGIGFDRKNGVSKLVLCEESFDPVNCHHERTTFIYNFKELTWKHLVPQSLQINEKGEGPRLVGPAMNANAQIVNERLLCWLMHDVPFLCIPYMVLFFDLEEEEWLDPILLHHESFVPICIAELENDVCLVGRTYGWMELRLLKFDMQHKVLRSEEYISPPPPPSFWKHGHLSGGPGVVVWVEEDKRDARMQHLWVFEMSHHCWECLGTFPLTDQDYYRGDRICFESTLFRFG